jgi:hypothetical protein
VEIEAVVNIDAELELDNDVVKHIVIVVDIE